MLLTGATGFVGQAVLEKLLSGYPDTRVSLLVRPSGKTSAPERVEQLLHKPVFSRWQERVGSAAAAAATSSRVDVIEGDLERVPDLPGDLTHVIHCASSVSFDGPVDTAFRHNVQGPAVLYHALLQTGADPHVVHVSTCYVAGLRKGVVEERRLPHEVDREEETRRALAAREEAESASRRSDVLDRLTARARSVHRRAGAQAVAQESEAARRAWVDEQLVRAGRSRATSLGWPDVYTFSKALGERVAEELWGQEHRLSVVRPAIIESALTHPYPGWIDGFKVADPLIAAYGRGMLPEFPALADTILDLIPVDHVVNATLAAAASPPSAGEPQYFQVASGLRNPLRFGEVVRIIRAYFRAHPLRDDAGHSLQVPNWTFPDGPVVERHLRRRELAVGLADTVVGWLPATDSTRWWTSSIYKAGRDLRTLRKFTDLYAPYTRTEVVFDDSRTKALHDSLPQEARAEHGFDVEALDWRQYLQEVHVPTVPGLMHERKHDRGLPPGSDPKPADDVVAVFDLHGTMVAANLLEYYTWVELATHGGGRAVGNLAGMVGRSRTYLQAERRDRGDFIRSFMRRYEGTDEEELRQVIRTRVAPLLRSRLHAEAVERVRAHRAAGHRTLLVTGQIDVFVEPLSDFFDIIVAGQMEKDPAGRWTGHLASSPLVDEARAAWLERWARDEGVDLSGSSGYGDTYADRPWLQLLGRPNVVNPDLTLYRYARSHGWQVHSWGRVRSGPVRTILKARR